MKVADTNILEVNKLRTSFFYRGYELPAVDDISFALGRGKIVALVGESGCGKSVTGYSILRLIDEPGKIVGGQILLKSREEQVVDILALPARSDKLFEIRGGAIAMIFQEPMTALSPVHTIGNQIFEAVRLHQRVSRSLARKRALKLLQDVGLPDPALHLRQYPHEISGGMRQRVVIAMALAGNPELIIADEPTTALDVTIQAQILSLIKSLQRQNNLSVLLITHDLGVVAQTADEVMVMYMGRIVEQGPMPAVIKHPLHPYTRALLLSLPTLGSRRTSLQAIPGSVPSLYRTPTGCAFHPRCEFCLKKTCDADKKPELRTVGDGRKVACLRAEEWIK